jgi:serine/threonine protein kinase/TPR repeat protein
MIGRNIGNYRITSLIGEGGMGLVYLAEHATIERKVAVKVLRNDLPASSDIVTRFVNEARVAATIRHPNVIEVLDTGMLQPESVPYIVMELLEGESLAERLARLGRLEIGDATLWVYETAAALGVAHARGIIHRDLKPANLFLVADDRQPEREKIKVLDFGIAKLRGELASMGSQTQTGSLLGTPRYMSPEQCRGTKEIDTRSDIYSLGIVFYEILCGAPPFTSTGFGELISMHLTAQPAPPRSHNPAISEALEAVILRALAKNPDDRFATIGELQAALGFEPSRISPTSAGLPARGASTGQSSLAAGGSATPPASTPRPSHPTPLGGGTQVASASIIMTPAPGSLGVGGASARTGANGRQRRVPIMIAGALLAAAVGIFAFVGGQIGPRLHCMTGKGCTELGDCYDTGHCGIARDRERACEIYDKDCTAGQMASCVRFGHCYEAHTGGIQSSWASACDLYEKACAADNLAGCAHFADCLRDGLGGRQAEVERACEFSQRACNGGEAYGCVGLGVCARSGLGDVARSGQEACSRFQQSCDAGDQVGCAWLGGCHTGDTPSELSHSEEAACEVFRKSCDAGGALSCGYLGACYRDGSGGLPKEEAKACDLFKRACDDAGFAERTGCDSWAACLREGLGGHQVDTAQADRIDESVCNDGDAHACATLAAAFDDGAKGKAKNPLRGCPFHVRACGGGLDCLKAGQCQCQGAVSSGVPDPAAAHEAFAKACKAGDKQACDEDKVPGCGVPLGAVAGGPQPIPVAMRPGAGQLRPVMAGKNPRGYNVRPGMNSRMTPAALAALKAGGRVPPGAMQRPGMGARGMPGQPQNDRKANAERAKVLGEIQ